MKVTWLINHLIFSDIHCYFLHKFLDFVLLAPCLTGTCVMGGEKKLRFDEKKPVKYFVSSRNCRTFALAFGKFSGAGL